MNMQVRILPENSIVIIDYRSDWVRVYVDDQNRVVREPHAGLVAMGLANTVIRSTSHSKKKLGFMCKII